MSASMIVLAAVVGAVLQPQRPAGAMSSVEVRGFVPASCRVTAAATTGCNVMAVRSIASGAAGRATIISVSPRF
jgi:hypothetical protein